MPYREIKFKAPILHKIIFILCLFVLLFIGAITFKHVNTISETSKLVMHSYEVKLELEQLFSYIKDSEYSKRGYLVSKDTLYLDTYKTATRNVIRTFLNLQKLTEDNHEQQDNLHLLFKLMNKRYDYDKSYPVQKSKIDVIDDSDLITNLNESNSQLIDVRNKLNKIIKLEEIFLQKRSSDYKNQIYLTPILTLGILIVTMLLIIFAYHKINKDVEKLQVANSNLRKSQFLSQQAEIIAGFCTWEWNTNTNKIEYSDNLFRILGLQHNSFKNGEEFLDYVIEADREELKNLNAKILNGEEMQNHYFCVKAVGGELKYLRASGKSFTDSLGNKTILGVTEDITVQHNKRELVRKSTEELLKINKELKIFDESSKQAEILGNYGSWVLNYDTFQFSYSDNQFRILGCEPQSFQPSTENYLKFVHPEDKLTFIEANENALLTKEIPTMDFRIIRKDGQIRHLKTIAKSYKDFSGTESMIGTTQDVTEDYNKSEELKEQNKELEQNIQELNEFNHVASHDLQEPLRKIQTFISRINEKEVQNLSDFGKEYLARIEKASNRMRVLINDLLQYSRTNRTEKTFVNTNLNQQLINSFNELSQIIDEKNAVINHVKLPNTTAVDFQMQQLFTNLISNSLKYAKENVAPIITVNCSEIVANNDSNIVDESSKKYYKIEFSDNGIGFDQENAEKIFLLFNRLHGKTEYLGTGVGLAICKKIVENHDGHIIASGQLGVGATFTIYLPIT